MTKPEVQYYGSENADTIQIINSRYTSPLNLLLTNGYYQNFSRVKEYASSETPKNIVKYRVILEPVSEIDIRPHAYICSSVEKEYRSKYGSAYTNQYNIISFGLINSIDYMNFLSNDNIQNYVGFCLFKLVPNKEFKRTNVTSKIIDAGRCTGVTVSKSKTDKDCYVMFQATTSNPDNVGVIFFKNAESYSMLRLALENNLILNTYRALDFSKFESEEKESDEG